MKENENALKIDLAVVHKVRMAAELNRIPLETMKLLASGQGGDPPGEKPELVGWFGTYRVCFSIEQHPGGWCNHLSVSKLNKVNNTLEPPPQWAVEKFLQVFGFQIGGTARARSWTEKGGVVHNEGNRAVNGAFNFVQEIKEDGQETREASSSIAT